VNAEVRPSAAGSDVPGFGCSRYAPIEFLPEATRFSDDPQLTDPVAIVRLLKQFPADIRALQEATQPAYECGRKRMRGNWSLVFLAFMLSGLSDMDRFHARWRSSGLWKAAGFKGIPSSRTLYLRFVELERYADAFEAAAHQLMRRARRHEKRVGRTMHIDGTGISTHASLEHFCPKGSGCKAAGPVARLGDDLVAEVRAAESELPEEALVEQPANSLKRLTREEVETLPFEPRHLYWGHNREHEFSWYRLNGHYYRLRDTTASPRKYGGKTTKPRFWVGWNDVTVTDTFTGAPLAIHVAPAGEQEWAIYPAAMTKTHERSACGRIT
jgi:hypothetical protein